MSKTKQVFSVLFVLTVLFALGLFTFWLIRAIWQQFASLSPTVGIAIVTGSSTILVSTFTIVLGRYFERKKELDALYRDKKVEIYDEFLKEFFNAFQNPSKDKAPTDTNDPLVKYFKEWQRKLLLWAGPEVIESYSQWMSALRTKPVNAESFFMTERLLLAIRKDLGHSNKGIQRGIFARLVMKNADLFLSMSKTNPNIALGELIAIENKIEEDILTSQK